LSGSAAEIDGKIPCNVGNRLANLETRPFSRLAVTDLAVTDLAVTDMFASFGDYGYKSVIIKLAKIG
jgi:hypothetical protein